VTRVKKFFYYLLDKKLTVSAAAVILGTASLSSNILGLLRERLIAGEYGASPMTDIFYASFRIPDLIFNLLILGALSSVFIPVFIEKMAQDKKEEAENLANSFLNFLLISAILFGIVIFILAPKLVPFLLPGLFSDGVQTDFNVYQTAVNLVRIMVLSPIFFAISGIFGGILNSHRKFIAYALAPIIYNLSIIFAMIFLIDKFDPSIYAPAIGVVGGAFLTVLIQLPSTIRTGWRWKPMISFSKGEIAKITKLMIPRTLTIGTIQINLVVATIVLSYMTGGISVFNYANNIQMVPVAIFGISIATAIFPALSESYSKKNMKEYIANLSWSIRRILYFIIPATIGIIVLRAQIVRLIFGVGNFDWEATFWTTKTLLFFSLSLFAQALVPLIIRGFYALQDAKTPFYISIVVMVVFAGLAILFPSIESWQLGPAGVALAFSIAAILNVTLLFFMLHEKVGILDPDHKVFESTARLIFSSLLMGITLYISLYFFDVFFDTHRTFGLFAQTTGSIALGTVIYFTLTWYLKCEETKFILEKIRRR